MSRNKRRGSNRGRREPTIELPPKVGVGPILVPNHYQQVAHRDSRGRWLISPPKPLRFTGAISRTELTEMIRSELGDVRMDLPDMEFLILDHDSWIDLQLWVKCFLGDIEYRYLNDRRDCNKFARIMRLGADLLGEVNMQGSPLLGGIYAHMDAPFAGITDGYHALNLSLTNQAAFVSEPQGINLHYQRLESWRKARRITDVFSD